MGNNMEQYHNNILKLQHLSRASNVNLGYGFQKKTHQHIFHDLTGSKSGKLTFLMSNWGIIENPNTAVSKREYLDMSGVGNLRLQLESVYHLQQLLVDLLRTKAPLTIQQSWDGLIYTTSTSLLNKRSRPQTLNGTSILHKLIYHIKLTHSCRSTYPKNNNYQTLSVWVWVVSHLNIQPNNSDQHPHRWFFTHLSLGAKFQNYRLHRGAKKPRLKNPRWRPPPPR